MFIIIAKNDMLIQKHMIVNLRMARFILIIQNLLKIVMQTIKLWHLS